MSNSPHHSGYLAQARSSASGLAIVVALHGVAIAAALLAKGAALVVPQPPIITTYDVPDQEVPPEIPPPPAEPETFPRIPVLSDTPVRPRDPLPMPPVFPPTMPMPPAPPPPLPPRDPVLVDARFDPAFLGALQPPYPARMQRAGREGNVTVRVRIGTDGRVTDVQRISADDDSFYEAVRRQALAHWRFVPATEDGRPVASWQRHTVRFELTG